MQSESSNERLIQPSQNHQEKDRIITQGRWTQKQNAQYYAFLVTFTEHFQSKEERRQFKVFKALSAFMSSRDPNQCRGHHHKLKKDYETADEIIQYLENKYERIGVESLAYLQQLKGLKIEDIGKEKNKKMEEGQVKYQLPEEVPQENKDHGQNMKTKAIYQGQPAPPPPFQHDHPFINPFNQPFQNPFSTSGLIPNLQYNQFRSQKGIRKQGQILPQDNPQFSNPYYSQQIKIKTEKCHESFAKWWSKINELIHQDFPDYPYDGPS